MGRKRKRKKETFRSEEEVEVEAQKMWENNAELQGIMSKNNWDFITKVNKNTGSILKDMWIDNVKANLQAGLWDKHAPLIDKVGGIGKDKATVGIGAGPSFNKNKDIFQYHMNKDSWYNQEDKNYITIAANHQYKPLLEMGVVPDYVLLCDGSDVVYDQLCTDIHKSGQKTKLITGLHCSHKTLMEWDKQGREILFYLNMAAPVEDIFEQTTGKKPAPYKMELGGNVLNGAWAISITKMGSNVFIGLGNDLSYDLHDDIEQRRAGYYADGDYSTNAKVTGTGRDEAKTLKKWAGFNLKRNIIVLPGQTDVGLDRYNVELGIVGTTYTLWVYKLWLEATLIRQTTPKFDKYGKYITQSFHYFNCSEGGILGVMAKDDSNEALGNKDNWYMFDDVCRFYHTAIARDVFEHFEYCREVYLDAKKSGQMFQVQ